MFIPMLVIAIAYKAVLVVLGVIFYLFEHEFVVKSVGEWMWLLIVGFVLNIAYISGLVLLFFKPQMENPADAVFYDGMWKMCMWGLGGVAIAGLGYLLYASMFAAVGACVDNQADTQQLLGWDLLFLQEYLQLIRDLPADPFFLKDRDPDCFAGELILQDICDQHPEAR